MGEPHLQRKSPRAVPAAISLIWQPQFAQDQRPGVVGVGVVAAGVVGAGVVAPGVVGAGVATGDEPGDKLDTGPVAWRTSRRASMARLARSSARVLCSRRLWTKDTSPIWAASSMARA